MLADTVAVLAPGESLTAEITDSLRGRMPTVAVNDALARAPWADVLVANDKSWWLNRPHAMAFSGRKFSANDVPGVETVTKHDWINSGLNSGALGMWVAHRILLAKQILLVGVDHGTGHFFGKHEAPLKNTPQHRLAIFAIQFEQLGLVLNSKGVRIYNCSPRSALKCFPMRTLEEML